MTLLSLFAKGNHGQQNMMLLGADSFLNDLLLEEVASSKKYADLERVTIDCESDGLDELIAALTESSLFAVQKLLVIKNPFFLTAKVPKKYQRQLKQLETIIANSNELDDVIIICANYEKIDKRKKISKMVTSHFELVETKVKTYQMGAVLSEYIKSQGGQITKQALNMLQDRSDSVLDTALSNAQKLLAIAPHKKIDENLVQHNIEISLAQNVFAILQSALAHHYEQAISRLHKELQEGDNPAQLLAIFAGQVEILLVIKILARRGRTSVEITKELGIHPYRVKLALQDKSTIKQLKSLLQQVISDDYKFKRGELTSNYFLDLLLLSC